MNILHLINTLTLGGAETMLMDSIEEIQKDHPETKNVIVTLIEKGYYASVASEKYTYYHFPLTLFRLPLVLFKIKRLIKKHNINVVHAHLFEAAIVSRLVKNKKLKVVNTYHTSFHSPGSIEFSKFRLLIDKLTIKKADTIVFVSKTVQKSIMDNLPFKNDHKLLVNFCNKSFYPSYIFSNDDSLRIICIGNLREQKNFRLLLNALVNINDNNISVDIFGEGPLRLELSKHISENKMNVILKGNVKVSPELFSKYDMFVMTSLHEGMPIALIEAMTCGVPSLLNDIPELKETAGDAAVYFDTNSQEDLADKLNMFLRNKLLLKTLSDNALSISKMYNIKNYIRNLMQIYST